MAKTNCESAHSAMLGHRPIPSYDLAWQNQSLFQTGRLQGNGDMALLGGQEFRGDQCTLKRDVHYDGFVGCLFKSELALEKRNDARIHPSILCYAAPDIHISYDRW